MTRPMIRVLGPIDVRAASGATSVGGPRQRALLGALVLAAGRAVSIDALIDVVWGPSPPRTATNTLQSYISGLRHRLGQDAVVRTDHSYELDLDAVDVDALQFERLVRAADSVRDDPEQCWTLCREALALWRGRPFGDLADVEPFELESYRLDELRMVAMEMSLESELALGHHDLVAGELESAVREHPYRERLWHLLIESLALSGRRVAAMRACSDFRAALGEVGVDPGDELIRLERRVLDGWSQVER